MRAVVDLVARLAEAETRYVTANPESRWLHEERARFMPGGNTRTTIHQPPFPLTIVHGEGARVFSPPEVFAAYEGNGAGRALARGALDDVRPRRPRGLRASERVSAAAQRAVQRASGGCADVAEAARDRAAEAPGRATA